jgi:tetratricopeptide (TPR) repeat protein
VIEPTNPIVVLPGAGDDSANRKAAQQAVARGQQAQRAKKYAEAIQFYRRAVVLDQDYFEAHYLLGLAGFQTRNFQLALSSWQAALALRPDSADARYNYALALKADNRFQASAEELEQLLALHPDEARGHLTLGNLYADQLRDIPRARRHYQRVLQLDPRNPQAQTIRFWLVSNPAS